jgi:hypothetical protein
MGIGGQLMGKYKYIELNRLIGFLKYKFKNTLNKKYCMTILTWQDGDYFKGLCLDDGGIIEKHLGLFVNKPLGKKFGNINELLNELNIYSEIPFFHSVNGNYKLFWDVYLYFDNYLIIYNVYLKRCYFKKYKNIFDKIFECFRDGPIWINEKQLELENYNPWTNYNNKEK